MLRESFGACASRSRQDMEDLWRFRLQQARDRHLIAAEESRKAIRECAEEMTPSDGSFGYQQLQAKESAALREYSRVLKIFADLVVSGQIPEEL